jgi:phytoene dehydrogenase-like protein
VARHVGDPGAVKWISALAGYITDDDGRATVSEMVPLFGYYFEGGYYPKGGSGGIAESLVSAIERRGGQVHFKSPVERIICEDGAVTGLIVRGSGGRTYRVRAKAVVCNADLRRMLTDLIADPELTKGMEAQVGPLQSACSAVGVHLGLPGPLDLPPIVHVAGCCRRRRPRDPHGDRPERGAGGLFDAGAAGTGPQRGSTVVVSGGDRRERRPRCLPPLRCLRDAKAGDG